MVIIAALKVQNCLDESIVSRMVYPEAEHGVRGVVDDNMWKRINLESVTLYAIYIFLLLFQNFKMLSLVWTYLDEILVFEHDLIEH